MSGVFRRVYRPRYIQPPRQAADALALFTITAAVGGTIGVSGDLAVAAATIAGAGGPIINASGGLASAAATMTGTAGPIVTVSGGLTSAAAAIAGAVSPIINVNGSLLSAAATMAGVFSDQTRYFTGALSSPNATIAGQYSFSLAPALFSGNLTPDPAIINGGYSVTRRTDTSDVYLYRPNKWSVRFQVKSRYGR